MIGIRDYLGKKMQLYIRVYVGETKDTWFTIFVVFLISKSIEFTISGINPFLELITKG